MTFSIKSHNGDAFLRTDGPDWLSSPSPYHSSVLYKDEFPPRYRFVAAQRFARFQSLSYLVERAWRGRADHHYHKRR